jgi:arabinogalactan oligomer/maltooligosaccharide transport system substrate-binding protein
MHKKIQAILLAALLVLGSITGCGAKDNSAPVAFDEEVSEDGALPSGDVSLRVWGAEEDAELVNSIISSFMSKYQGQANFKITFEPHSEANCKDDVLSDVLNAPDVFTFADDQLMALVASGVLKKVSNDSEISSRNLGAASDAASVNGTLYAYPLTADNGYFLFYNQKYLSEEDVQTMDGLLAAASKCGKQVFMEMTSGWYMYSFFGNTDMEIGLNDDGISTFCNWNAKYTNIKGVDVAEAMLKIGTNPAFSTTSNDGFVAGAADGTFVAGVSGIWDENGIKEAWGDDYAAVKLPTYTVAGQQLQMSSYAGYKLVGVNSYSPNAAWAAVFADWMTNEENQTLRFTMRGQGPSNTNAAGSGDIAQSKALKALQQQAEFSSLQRVGGTYWDAATTFGTAMAEGNPSGKSLQALLNEMVTGITGEETTGDPEGAEVVEEAAEEVVDEATEETSEEAVEEMTEEAAEEVVDEATEDTTEESTTTDADASTSN